MHLSSESMLVDNLLSKTISFLATAGLCCVLWFVFKMYLGAVVVVCLALNTSVVDCVERLSPIWPSMCWVKCWLGQTCLVPGKDVTCHLAFRGGVCYGTFSGKLLQAFVCVLTLGWASQTPTQAVLPRRWKTIAHRQQSPLRGSWSALQRFERSRVKPN